jgi:hypothetical protein
MAYRYTQFHDSTRTESQKKVSSVYLETDAGNAAADG